jgi:hypothetical protein
MRAVSLQDEVLPMRARGPGIGADHLTQAKVWLCMNFWDGGICLRGEAGRILKL